MGNQLCCRECKDDSNNYVHFEKDEPFPSKDFRPETNRGNYEGNNLKGQNSGRSWNNREKIINLNGVDSIKKIQRKFRNIYLKKKFNEKIKPSLQKYEKDYINYLYNKCGQNEFIEFDNNFSNNGYLKFYPNLDDFFYFNPGFVFKNQYRVNNPDDPNNLEIYKGEMNIDGKKHGKGFLVTPHYVRRGTWRYNLFTGWNKEKRTNGDSFEGKYISGYLDGKGIFKSGSGSTYEGDFSYTKRDGKGQLITSDYSYNGDFKDDKLDGIGTITFSDGNKYEGEFRNNEISGIGTFFWKNGDKYEGEVSNGRMDGYGKYTYANGEIYEGHYINGNKEGHGKISCLNGSTIEGEFAGGSLNGVAKYTKDNITSNVEYSNDKVIKK